MPASIRKATEADIDKICQIEAAGTGLWNRQQFTAELSLEFGNFLVLEADREVIGFAVSWYVADEIQLNNIGIIPEYRRRGMGTRLLDRLVADSYVRMPRPGKIVLEVSISNNAAMQFYKKNGFVETGRRKNYYHQSDAVLMIKEIRQ
jgi:[ribosomal protein S18]-alanine N-acetyltransferase